MERGILTKYSASAGSGKTYRLTVIYLSALFSNIQAYKKILAVTFTNKAAADIKRKILSSLQSFSSGEQSDMLRDLAEKTGLTEGEIRLRAGKVLHSILHDYSGFNVGTIDSFFQKVLRAFTREIGLQQGYVIVLDHNQILSGAVDETISATVKDNGLRQWITSFAKERIADGKSWNLRKEILKLAGEIFREKFRLMPEEEKKKLRDRELLDRYAGELKSIRNQVRERLSDYSDRCRAILNRHGAEDEMFLRGSRGGVGSFLKLMKEADPGDFRPLNSIVSRVLEDPPVWTSKAGPSPQLARALDDGFAELFTEAVNYYSENYLSANSASLISGNIYVLGILSDILENVHKITTSQNRFLLSDAGELLYLVIRNDQTPFIYEKTGNRFSHFMIDEFQDTSLIQWNNFLPLVSNSMAEGNDNLVVGDVKQSIYRWRNSDWKILGMMLDRQIDPGRIITEHLSTNWRSRKNIIAFNNSLFSVIPQLIDDSDKNLSGSRLLGSLYHDVPQDCPPGRDGGHVRIEFIGDEDLSFTDLALARIPPLIEHLHDQGYSGSDIGILVRSNREGALVLKTLIDYRAAAEPSKLAGYNYNAVSAESLFLAGSPAVCFIISVLRLLCDPGDRLSNAVMLRSWLLSLGRDPLEADLSDTGKWSDMLYPPGWQECLERLKEKPLVETVEGLIRFFSLGRLRNNTAFLNAFQDHVMEFTLNNQSDLSSFLDWWDQAGNEKSVILSDQQDSIRIMTIHKSKGLEFRIVIVPFISWNFSHGWQAPIMWLTPSTEPLNTLQMVPVRYKSAMQYSEFAPDYFDETYYSLVDNLNLLYVAFTRAVDGLYGFAPSDARSATAGFYLFDALQQESKQQKGKPAVNLPSCLSENRLVFEFGNLGVNQHTEKTSDVMDDPASGYFVNQGSRKLNLRLHGRNLFLRGEDGRQARLNYGKLMHEVFEEVRTLDDIPGAVEQMVMEGRIPASEKQGILQSLSRVAERPKVREWFRPGLRILAEAEILLSDGTTRRPDRVIIEGDRVTIIDFKFGDEKAEYFSQVNNYKRLISGMGYPEVEAYIWYVDKDKIAEVK